MSDLGIKARLDADGTKLVGQLGQAEAAARGLEDAFDKAGREAKSLDGAVDQVNASTRQATSGARAHGAALKEEGAAAKVATTQNHALAQSQDQLQQASARNTSSLAAQRAGYQQLGFQMQDIFQQAALGINPLVILAQQGGQTASAISMMGNAQEGTQSKMVRFATFLSGPYGAAVFGVVTILGFMIQNLLDSEEATEKAGDANETLAEKLDTTRHSYNEVIEATRRYNDETQRSGQTALQAAEAASVKAKANYAEAASLQAVLVAMLKKQRAEIDSSLFASESDPTNKVLAAQAATAIGHGATIAGRLADAEKELGDLKQAVLNTSFDLAEELAKIDTDPAAKITEHYAKLREELRGSSTDAQALRRDLAQLNRAEQAAKEKIRESERAGRSSDSRGSEREAFGSPLQGSLRISGRFGEKRKQGHNHGGLDYEVSVGTPVYATQSGVVDFAGRGGAYGNLIKLGHGAGTETRYAHLQRFAVERGAEVQKGDLIGYSGNTGRSTGPHLHYEVRINGKAVDPTKGAFPVDPLKIAQSAQKAVDANDRFGERAQDKVDRALGSYGAAPRGIDKALSDLKEMDQLIAELGQRKPPGFEETIASAEKAKDAIQGGIGEQITAIGARFEEIPRAATDAEIALSELEAIGDALREANPPDLDILIDQLGQAKAAVEEGLNAPFREMREESERRQQIDLLILQGREAEARTLEEIWRLERDLGPLSAERRAEVEAIVLAEEEHLDRLEQAQKLQSAYLSTTQSVRGELEAIFAGKGDLSNFKQVYKDLKAKVMVEQIFGPTLDAFDDYVKENTAIDQAVDDFADETYRAGDALGDLTGVVLDTARVLANPQAAWMGDFDAALGTGEDRAVSDVEAEGGIIKVVGSRDVSEGIEKSNSVLGMTPERYFDQLTKRLTQPLLEELDSQFGVEFFSQMQGAVSGYLYGSSTGGTVGGILGAASGLFDQFGVGLFGNANLEKGISQRLQDGLAGAQTGSMVAGVGNMFGLNMSSTGAQFGGMAGSFLPIPGGQIIGSIAGGLLGGMFTSKPYGTASLGAGSISASGKQADVASGLGGSVQSGLDRIIDALGAELGAYKVSIGTYNDSYRVSTTGYSGDKLNYKGSSAIGLHSFTNEADAIAFAIADAISDGAVKGISDKMQKALRSSDDLDEAVAEALKVREIEELLSGVADATNEELREFERVAQERLRIGREYGFDLVALEELNAEERAQIVEDILTDRVGSLRQLLEDLTFGDLAEGTLAERRQRLLGEISDAETAAANGEDGAADRLANLNRQLVQLSREAYGTAGTEYGADRDQAIASAERIIAQEEERLQSQQDAVTDRLDQGNALSNETNNLLAQISAGIAQLNNTPSASTERAAIAPGGLGGGSRFDTTREVLR